MMKKGDEIILNGHRYILGDKIGGGQEGTVFNLASSEDTNIDCSKFAVKIINSSNLSKEQCRTIHRRMRDLKRLGDTNKELRKRMSLPRELISNGLGYVMKKMAGGDSLKKYLDPGDADFKEWYRDRYTLSNRYNLIAGIFDSLREIHINGLIFTDLSPNNVLVKTSPEGYTVFFIDTDNLRSRDDPYSGVLGTPGYMAPEIYRKNITNKIGDYERTRGGTPVRDLLSPVGKISVDSDVFSAAVIAFQLLTLHHPFVGDIIDCGTPEDEERAHRIETDYIFKKGTNNTSSAHLVPAFEQITTPEIRKLFYRTFVDGINNPGIRPTDQEFLEAFLAAKDLMAICPKCGFSTVYSKPNTQCLGCDRELGPLPILKISQSFSNLSPEDVLSKKIPPLMNENLVEDRKEYTISRVVLTPGIEKKLHLRNFEQRRGRGEIVASIKVSNEGMATMRLVHDRYPNTSIITKRTGNIKAFKEPIQLFSINGHTIRFDEYPGSDDTTYCRLEGVFSWE